MKYHLHLQSPRDLEQLEDDAGEALGFLRIAWELEHLILMCVAAVHDGFVDGFREVAPQKTRERPDVGGEVMGVSDMLYLKIFKVTTNDANGIESK